MTEKFKTTLFCLAVIVIIIALLLPLFYRGGSSDLDRLDKISARLSDIGLEIKTIDGQITELENQKNLLTTEQTELNEEAQAIFLSLVKPEVEKGKEEAETNGIEKEVETGVNQLYKCAHGDGETYRNIQWRCNSNGMAQDIPQLEGVGRHERMQELLNYYGVGDLYDTFIVAARAHRVYPELGICIAKADTSLGNALKTQGNIGNVGNTDNGATQAFDNNYIGVWKIFETLNNRYLGSYSTVDKLSRKFNKDGKIYAGSQENRHNNVLNCLGVIYNKTLPDDWNYRF